MFQKKDQEFHCKNLQFSIWKKSKTWIFMQVQKPKKENITIEKRKKSEHNNDIRYFIAIFYKRECLRLC